MFGLSFKIESKSCVLRFIVLGTLSRISWFILEDDDAGVKDGSFNDCSSNAFFMSRFEFV